MSEEQGNQEQVADQNTGVDADSIMAKANAAAERLERANAESLKIVERQEALAVQNKLDGSANTNVAPPKEESDEDYAKKVLAGDV